MNSLPITCKDAPTTFLLARRAERLARPHVDRIEGGLLSIEVNLEVGAYFQKPYSIDVSVHRVRKSGVLGRMALQAFQITTSAELERAIERLKLVAKDD